MSNCLDLANILARLSGRDNILARLSGRDNIGTPVFKHSKKRENVQNQWLLYQVTAHMWPSYGAIYENFNLALLEKNAFDVLALSI